MEKEKMEKETNREKRNFKTLDKEQLLAWWIFYKQDEEIVGESTPKTILNHIQEFNMYMDDDIISLLEGEYK